MNDGLAEDLRFDLHGRVRNLGLPPSQLNALIPLFEAISNALHALDSRFGREVAEQGLIRITINRYEADQDGNAAIRGFHIYDNGIGLNHDNWESFRTVDSPHKRMKGGKGIGRLSWLKAFESASVDSTYAIDDSFENRNFTFGLPIIGSSPIQGLSIKAVECAETTGTLIGLNDYKDGYSVHCPRKADTVASRIIGHFLERFVSESVPTIVLADGVVEIDLTQFYKDNIVSMTSEDISPDGSDESNPEHELTIKHILLRKSLKFQDGGKHWLLFAGDGRIVVDENIDSQIGLGLVGPDRDCVYIGLVSGRFLDGHTNQERTTFTFPSVTMKSVHRDSVTRAKSYLSEYINDVRIAQAQTTQEVIRSNPQFLSVTNDVAEFARSHLGLSTHSEEDIYLELSRQKLRMKRRVREDIKRLEGSSKEEIDDKVQLIARAINLETKGSLAEYVIKRKEILDLLDNSLAYIDPVKRDYLREEIVHDLIVPIRSDSDKLDYEDHNLWILDDRLAFYSYFKSDKPFNTFLDTSTSRSEADVAVVFDRSLALNREGGDEPIIIVEFKKPGRNTYDGNSNPVSQVLRYVDEFRRSPSVHNKDGKLIKKIPDSTRFICYVVADFTEKLVEVVRLSPANTPTADGEGFFGFSTQHNAYIEVIPYHKVLHDARLRNEAFFAKLGLK